MTVVSRHARQRAQERFGIDLTEADANYLVQRIEAGEAFYAGRGSKGVRIYVAYLPRIRAMLTLGYAPETDKIVTVLPEGARPLKRINLGQNLC